MICSTNLTCQLGQYFPRTTQNKSQVTKKEKVSNLENWLDFCVLFQTLQDIHSHMEVEGILGCLERTWENVIQQGHGRRAINKYHSDCRFPEEVSESPAKGGNRAGFTFIGKGHNIKGLWCLVSSHQSLPVMCLTLARVKKSVPGYNNALLRLPQCIPCPYHISYQIQFLPCLRTLQKLERQVQDVGPGPISITALQAEANGNKSPLEDRYLSHPKKSVLLSHAFRWFC
jgi:hypothetical protein